MNDVAERQSRGERLPLGPSQDYTTIGKAGIAEARRIIAEARARAEAEQCGCVPDNTERKPMSDKTPEELAELQKESAEHIAKQQAEFAESQEGYTGEAPAADPSTVNDDQLAERGFALTITMTSPGGPWHGLPPEAQYPDSPDYAENCRWAAVGGSYFACTFDGTTTIGDHAENVRAFGIPQDPEGTGYMRSISTLPEDEKVEKCISTGNNIAYRGDNLGYTVAG